MADIAPIPAPIQPAPQSTQTSSSAEGGESAFGSILEETTAAQQATAPQKAADNPQQTDNTGDTSFSSPARETPDEQLPDTRNGLTENLEHMTSRIDISANEIVLQSPPQSFKNLLTTNLQHTVLLTPADSETADIPFSLTGSQLPLASTLHSSEEPIISAQLQQLINLNEKGVITITRQDGPAVNLNSLNGLTQPVGEAAAASLSRASTETVTAAGKSIQQQTQTAETFASATAAPMTSKAVSGQVVPLQEKIADTTFRGDAKSTHLRQDTQGQYLEARIEAGVAAGNSQEQQAGQQDLTSAQTQANNQASQTTSTASESAAGYSQVSQGILDPTAKTATPAQPAAPLPGAIVNEEAVIQQVYQKFNVQLRDQQTQINIKLHPAELGELKIDLTFREGAIRANVFAQTQQVQEILEKNMPRLRELLEGQGIRIEDIQVTAKSDIIGDFDLLQDQLSKRDSSEHNTRNSFAQNELSETLESLTADPEPDMTGVNVTI